MVTSWIEKLCLMSCSTAACALAYAGYAATANPVGGVGRFGTDPTVRKPMGDVMQAPPNFEQLPC